MTTKLHRSATGATGPWLVALTLLAHGAAGCQNRPSAASSAESSSPDSSGSSSVATGDAQRTTIAVQPLELVRDRGAQGESRATCFLASLGADGSVTSNGNNLARVEGNRVVLTNGTELFHIDEQGLTATWTGRPAVARGADGSFDTRQGRVRVADDGAIFVGDQRADCRVANYQPSMRDTATIVFMTSLLRAMYDATQASEGGVR